MYRTLIIEDEPLGAERLRKLIMNLDDTISVVGPLRSVEEVKEALRSDNDYDLIFSDIRLVGGFVFEAFREVFPKAPVIFTTAYDEYAIRAFKNNGIDYLLKPIDPDELRIALDKAKRFTSKEEGENKLENLMLTSGHRVCKCLLVPKGDELVPVKTSEICYIYKDTAVKAYLADGRRFILPFGLGSLEDMLDPEEFFRLNRQYIVNRNSIERISLFFHSRLLVRLKNCKDDNIIISKEKTAQFKTWLSG